MFEYTVREIADAVGGALVQGNPETAFSEVSTDTRKIQPGSFFIALIGERFDAHNFLGTAVAQGAGGLLVSKLPTDLGDLQLPIVVVENTLQALQALGRHNRRKSGIPVVAITGSVGKTTTKDMIAGVLEQKYQVHKTGGNFNNEIGLPLTLLGINPSHQVAVVEMGMRGRGEIRQLARLAEPTLGVISNIGETHIELLGSVENIALAKGELINELPGSGTIVLNGDDHWLRKLGAQFAGQQIYYGFQENNQVRALDWHTTGAAGCEFRLQVDISSISEQLNTEVTSEGQPDIWQVSLPVWGRHNVQNALAAIAVGLKFGLNSTEIHQGLAQVTLSAMRLEVVTDRPWVIINDAYNANPDSSKAALSVLADFPCSGKRIAVLGNMLELGTEAEKGHRAVGEAVAELGIDQLITLGDLAEWIADEAMYQGMQPTKVTVCREKMQAAEVLQQGLKPGDVVLIKGSRGMKMEEIIESI